MRELVAIPEGNVTLLPLDDLIVEIERLRPVLAAAKAFVSHVPPDDCTHGCWFAGIDEYVKKRRKLELELQAAVEAAERSEV